MASFRYALVWVYSLGMKPIYRKLFALGIIIITAAIAFFVYHTEAVQNPRFKFHYGLDMSGGVQLIYKADTSKLAASDIKESLTALRGVVERRVNKLGVTEPSISTESSSLASGEREYRLIVELPSVTDIQTAENIIGKTPTLMFKTERTAAETEAILKAQGNIKSGTTKMKAKMVDGKITLVPDSILLEDPYFKDTELTGEYLKRARTEFSQSAGGGQLAGAPIIALEFNEQGAKLFAKMTKENIGKRIGIYLDGELQQAPVVQTEISDGNAIITGTYTPDEVKRIVRDLNQGALPIPISKLSSNVIGPTLGQDALAASFKVIIIGFLAIVLFMLLLYRLPGLIAGVALAIYGIVTLALFKLVPITLTAAGIAGFVISFGIAIDSNILVFERMKEEFKKGRTLHDAITTGFDRAWTSIRDANLSGLITSLVLFWFGTSLIQGFAITLGLGILVSMFTALVITKTLLHACEGKDSSKVVKFLFGIRNK